MRVGFMCQSFAQFYKVPTMFSVSFFMFSKHAYTPDAQTDYKAASN